ncbi:MAG: hypothetical protein V4787_21575 [Pseudomonadota bacterium]
MRFTFLVPLAAIAVMANGHAQVFRCAGNVYTNNAAEARANGCKPMEGGHITVVEGTRVQSGGNAVAPPVRIATAPQRVDADEQRARDSDARGILEAELKKAEARQAELVKEYNNGDPEKLGPEHRNNQKYLDRVAELKANIARNENDIAGIKRELGRAR